MQIVDEQIKVLVLTQALKYIKLTVLSNSHNYKRMKAL